MSTSQNVYCTGKYNHIVFGPNKSHLIGSSLTPANNCLYDRYYVR